MLTYPGNVLDKLVSLLVKERSIDFVVVCQTLITAGGFAKLGRSSRSVCGCGADLLASDKRRGRVGHRFARMHRAERGRGVLSEIRPEKAR